MHRWLIRTIALFALLAGASAHGQDRVALVVANAAYKEAALQNPGVDAELVRPALERMGFDVTVVKDADLATFALALDSFYAKAEGADLALFYFAGHGFAVGGELGAENYLMSVSADVTSKLDVIIRSGGIDLDEIIASVANAAKVSLVFVDACRNDPRLSRGGASGRGLARISDVGMGSAFVGLSTRLGDLAEDGDEGAGSPFARAFAEYMPTPGLRLDDAFRRVRQAVIEATGGDQRPEARDDLDAPLIVLNTDRLAPEAPDAVVPEPAVAATDVTDPQLLPWNTNMAALAAEEAPAETAPQRAIYYRGSAEGVVRGQAIIGTATWAEISKDGQPAIRATLLIPDLGATINLTIYKNYDAVFPASHLVEIQFNGALTDSPIQGVPGLFVKSSELETGDPLAGAAVPVTNELFWIALSDEEAEIARNLQLLREGLWFDIPILFSDQTRALVTFEGAPGEEIVASVVNGWSAQSDSTLPEPP